MRYVGTVRPMDSFVSTYGSAGLSRSPGGRRKCPKRTYVSNAKEDRSRSEAEAKEVRFEGPITGLARQRLRQVGEERAEVRPFPDGEVPLDHEEEVADERSPEPAALLLHPSVGLLVAARAPEVRDGRAADEQLRDARLAVLERLRKVRIWRDFREHAAEVRGEGRAGSHDVREERMAQCGLREDLRRARGVRPC